MTKAFTATFIWVSEFFFVPHHILVLKSNVQSSPPFTDQSASSSYWDKRAFLHTYLTISTTKNTCSSNSFINSWLFQSNFWVCILITRLSSRHSSLWFTESIYKTPYGFCCFLKRIPGNLSIIFEHQDSGWWSVFDQEEFSSFIFSWIRWFDWFVLISFSQT